MKWYGKALTVSLSVDDVNIDDGQHVFQNNVNKLNYLIQLFKPLSADNLKNKYFKINFLMLSFSFFAIKLPILLTLQHKHFLAS